MLDCHGPCVLALLIPVRKRTFYFGHVITAPAEPQVGSRSFTNPNVRLRRCPELQCSPTQRCLQCWGQEPSCPAMPRPHPCPHPCASLTYRVSLRESRGASEAPLDAKRRAGAGGTMCVPVQPTGRHPLTRNYQGWEMQRGARMSADKKEGTEGLKTWKGNPPHLQPYREGETLFCLFLMFFG